MQFGKLGGEVESALGHVRAGCLLTRPIDRFLNATMVTVLL